MAPVNDGGWDLVATWLEQEMAERGISKAHIVKGAHIDQRTLDKLLDGRGISRSPRAAALATFLGYRGDAFDRLRRGDEPVPRDVTGGEAELRFRAVERRLDRIEAMLESALLPPDPRGDAQ